MSNDTLKDGDGFIKAIFTLAFLFCIMFRGIFAGPERAVITLEKVGFSDVEVLNHGWVFPAFRGCGADAAIIATEGTNPIGKKVQIDVCIGWPFKGSTIRGD